MNDDDSYRIIGVRRGGAKGAMAPSNGYAKNWGGARKKCSQWS